MAIGTMLATYQKLEENVPVTGTIVDFRVVQTQNWDTKRPKYFKGRDEDGDFVVYDPWMPDGTMREPVCQWEITLDTGVEDENGDTERRVFLDPRRGRKGSAVEGKRGLDAIGIALKKAKAHRVGLELGGRLTVTNTGLVRPAKGEAACNTYTADYEAPEGGAGTGRAVDEVPWLIGGGRYSPTERQQPAAVAQIETVATGPADGSARLGIRETTVVRPDDTPPF